MAMQETIRNFTEKYEKAVSSVLNINWLIIQVVVVFSVIALLYEGGFIGVSIILYKLLQVFVLGTVLFTALWLYLKGISYILKKGEPRQKARREQFKQELKKELLKELNGRRKK